MASATYTQAGRLMEVAAPLGKDALLLTGFTGREGISQLFQFQLDLLAENAQEIAFDKLLGQPVVVRLALGGGKSRYFHGILSRFSPAITHPTFTPYPSLLFP